MIFFTAFVVFDYGTMRFVMLGLGIIGTVSQIIVLRKRKKESIVIPMEEIIEQDTQIKAS
jgi:hypothetical protein